MKMRNKIFLSIYAVLCLIQFPISIRWNGRTSGAYFQGAVFALFAFGIPILFARYFSSLLAKWTKKPFVEVFNTSLTVIIICCYILIGFSSYFMLTFSFH
jgi:hypothetical protein